LMQCVSAAMLMALSAVTMFHRYSGSCGFANVQRGAVTAEHFHRRPFRQHWKRWRCM
jgi:hypothetical protein